MQSISYISAVSRLFRNLGDHHTGIIVALDSGVVYAMYALVPNICSITANRYYCILPTCFYYHGVHG